MELAKFNLEEVFGQGARYHLITTDDWDGLQVIAKFFSVGIKNGEKCIYYGDTIDVERLFNEFDKQGINLAACMSSGQFHIRPSLKFRVKQSIEANVEGFIEAINNVIDGGYSGIRVLGDRECFSSTLIGRNIYTFEREIRGVFEKYPLTSMHTYNIDRFGPNELFELIGIQPDFIYKASDTVYVHDGRSRIYPNNMHKHVKTIVKEILSDRQNLKKENTVYKFLTELASELIYKDNPREVLTIVLKKYVRACIADIGMIKLFKNGELRVEEEILVTENMPEDFLEAITKDKDNNSENYRIISSILSSKKCLCIDRGEDAPEYMKATRSKYGIKSCIAVPILLEEKVVGFLYLASLKRRHSFKCHSEFLLESCKNTISILGSQVKLLNMYEHISQMQRMDALGVLASGIAHEFNNLLTPVLGFSQILKEKIDDPSLKLYLSIIENSAKDGAMIVKRIQEFTRREDKKSRIQVDINEIISNAIYMTQPKWKNEAEMVGKRIDVVKRLSSLGYVLANPTEMREVVTNLLINAYDAIEYKGTIQVESWNEGENICFSIKDDGIGMSEETLSHIFTPFFTTKNQRGTGLGLPIVYNIIRSHGGTINAESTLGKGSAMIIKLPAYSFEVMESASDDLGGKLKGKVLVIDDQEPVANIVKSMLEEFGFEVDTANCGKDGVEMYSKGVYDLVYSDLAMPDMTGVEVAENIRQIDGKAPVILMTGWATGITESDRRYISGVIDKPFTMRAMYDSAKNALEERYRI